MLCSNESKVSTSIRDRFLLKNALVDYNGNYQYVKYGHDAIIWNDLGYVAECLKCGPLSDNDVVIDSIYTQSTNTLSVQVSLNTLRKD
jgi:hypothetical protein